MTDIVAKIKARRGRGSPAVKLGYVADPDEVDDDSSSALPDKPTNTTVPGRKRKADPVAEDGPGDDDDDDEDEETNVHAEESFLDEQGHELLVSIKRTRAIFHRYGFSQIDPRAIAAIDRYLKGELKQIAITSKYLCALRGRSVPTAEDGIAAVQERGVFPSVLLG